MLEFATFAPFLAYLEGTQIFLLVPLIPLVAFVVWLFQWPASSVKIKPIKASRFRPELVPKKVDTIVIGSGSGGE